MFNFTQIFESPFFLLKIIILIIILFYVVFTAVVLTQVNVMNKIITEDHTSKLLKTIAIIHTALAFSLFIITLVIL